MSSSKPRTLDRQMPNRLLKNVASGLQPGATGAQEPECTEEKYMRMASTAQARIKAAQ